MEIVTIVITAAAGAAVRRVLNLKLGDYVDPDNHLQGITADTVEDLIVTVFLNGGTWVIGQVMRPGTPLKIDPKLEAEIDAKLRAIKERAEEARKKVRLKEADRLRLFSEIKNRVRQLEAVLRSRGKAFSSSDFSERENVHLLEMFGRFFWASLSGTFYPNPKWTKKIRFTIEDENVRIEYTSSNWVSISPTEDGKVSIYTRLNKEMFNRDGKPVEESLTYDAVEPAMEYIKEVYTVFLEAIEQRG